MAGEEFEEWWEAGGKNQASVCSKQQAELIWRVARDKALVEAAKSMCEDCRLGVRLVAGKPSKVFYHVWGILPHKRCGASEIHRLRN